MVRDITDKTVLQGTQAGHKTYNFNQSHDPHEPFQFWYQDSDEGLILFVVFYTLACRWSRCLGCNLPSSMSGTPIDYKALMAQIDCLYRHDEIVPQLSEIRKIIVSNNGSVLDEKTFSSTALMYFLAKTNLSVPHLQTLTLETRPEYVDLAELLFIDRALKEGDTPTQLEIAIGFEAFSESIRNEFFHKGLSLENVENLAQKLAQYHCKLKCYFMLKPIPGMSDREAIKDIHQAIEYLSQLAQKYQLAINLHLNPTYVAKGTPLEIAFAEKKYTPPTLADVIASILPAEGKPIKIFVGLYDEGLAVEGGSFIRAGDEEVFNKLQEFNRTGDFSGLKF
ncbi:MAG: hypothetical protein AB4290_14140 [Spirulina sp.]